VIGTVYLLHFEQGLPIRPGRVARHYIGWAAAGDVDARLAQHLAGRGSLLVAAGPRRSLRDRLVAQYPRFRAP
jgi:hypothetical protein